MKRAGHLLSAFLLVTLGAQAQAQAPHEGTMMVDHPCRLLGATTPAADKVEFHNATEENGVARMRPMRSDDVAPGASVAFNPGGMHIMLVGLKQPLKEGQTIALTLNFEKAGKEDVTVPVGKIGAMQYGDADAAAHGAHDHAH
jgi:copper(I)-binding protein